MVLGFVGILIALERAVALGRRVGYVAPALLGLGAVLLIAEPTEEIGAALLTAGSLTLCLIYVPLWRRNRDDAVLISALGAVCALGGALLWRGGADTSQTIPWLAGFVILTIGGERLELARLAMPPTAACWPTKARSRHDWAHWRKRLSDLDTRRQIHLIAELDAENILRTNSIRAIDTGMSAPDIGDIQHGDSKPPESPATYGLDVEAILQAQ